MLFLENVQNVTIRGKLYDAGFGSDFFATRPRAQATEEEN